MLRTTIPKMWRRAKIIAILKPGKSPEEAGNNRPIGPGRSTTIVQQPEGLALQKYPQTRLLMILVDEVV